MSERKTLTDEQKSIIYQLYVNEKRGQAACARAAGTSVRIVKRYLQEEKIPIRNFSEAATASNMNRRQYDINDDYFCHESPNMAYLLGFIAADGSISKRENELKIGLSAVDKEFLQTLATEMGSNRQVKEYTNAAGYNCCEWHCSSKKIKDTLAKYNIVPAKTYTFTFPRHLKREYWIDFIRGYFDGDGCISTAGKSALRWQIVAANKDVLQTIIDYFWEEYNIPKVSIQEKGSTPCYYFQYSTSATKQIYKILYRENSLYLPRKKEKFDTLLKIK